MASKRKLTYAQFITEVTAQLVSWGHLSQTEAGHVVNEPEAENTLHACYSTATSPRRSSEILAFSFLKGYGKFAENVKQEVGKLSSGRKFSDPTGRVAKAREELDGLIVALRRARPDIAAQCDEASGYRPEDTQAWKDRQARREAEGRDYDMTLADLLVGPGKAFNTNAGRKATRPASPLDDILGGCDDDAKDAIANGLASGLDDDGYNPRKARNPETVDEYPSKADKIDPDLNDEDEGEDDVDAGASVAVGGESDEEAADEARSMAKEDEGVSSEAPAKAE